MVGSEREISFVPFRDSRCPSPSHSGMRAREGRSPHIQAREQVSAAPRNLVVNRKGLSAAFLPKISAEIRQKDFLIRNVLSVFLQKEAVSAERCSFGRNNLFLQPDYLKMRHCFAMKGTSGLQKEAVSAERTSFCRNSFFRLFLYFCRKAMLSSPSFCFLQKDKNSLSVDL